MTTDPMYELLVRAMKRQTHGADEALTALLGDELDGMAAEAVYAAPREARWRDPDRAELRLRRFLQQHPV